MGKTSLSFHMQLLLGKEQRQALLSTIGNTPARLTSRGEVKELKILLKSIMIGCPEINGAMTQKLPAQWESISSDQCTWLQGQDIAGI